VNKEVNRDKTGEADEMNLEVGAYFKDEVMHIWTSDLWLPRDAMHKRGLLSCGVCVSVCLSVTACHVLELRQNE